LSADRRFPFGVAIGEGGRYMGEEWYASLVLELALYCNDATGRDGSLFSVVDVFNKAAIEGECRASSTGDEIGTCLLPSSSLCSRCRIQRLRHWILLRPRISREHASQLLWPYFLTALISNSSSSCVQRV
jgi:hypothetical protein